MRTAVKELAWEGGSFAAILLGAAAFWFIAREIQRALMDGPGAPEQPQERQS